MFDRFIIFLFWISNPSSRINIRLPKPTSSRHFIRELIILTLLLRINRNLRIVSHFLWVFCGSTSFSFKATLIWCLSVVRTNWVFGFLQKCPSLIYCSCRLERKCKKLFVYWVLCMQKYLFTVDWVLFFIDLFLFYINQNIW